MVDAADSRLPLPGEVLSSWLSRRLSQMGVERRAFDDALAHRFPEVIDALAKDPDFPEGRAWRFGLEKMTGVSSTQLQSLGWPSSPWVLMPGSRRSACLLCLAEASRVTEQFVREHWVQSWRTTCSIHQVPLLEVPAVGAAWSALPKSSRKLHGSLMRRPDRQIARLIDGWEKVPAYLREAVFGAELHIMDAWSEHFSIGKAEAGPIVVWRDLLTLCASSWNDAMAPPVASQALPSSLITGSIYFRTPCVPPCPSTNLSLSHFRTLTNPAARRTCLVTVLDAMYEVSSKRVIGLRRQPTWGWPKVVPCLPEVAWDWLQRQSKSWPTGWQMLVDRWRSSAHTRMTDRARLPLSSQDVQRP